MKYRIKVVRYASEREEFHIEYRQWGLWKPVIVARGWGEQEPAVFTTVEKAMKRIYTLMDENADARVVNTYIVFEIDDKP